MDCYSDIRCIGYLCSVNGDVYHVDSPATDCAIRIDSVWDESQKSVLLDKNYLVGKEAKSVLQGYMKTYDCFC